MAKIVAAGAFKQGCLALIDAVASTREEIVITKRGKPLARLVPLATPEAQERELLLTLRDAAVTLPTDSELLEPSSAYNTWSALSEKEQARSKRGAKR